MTDEETIKRLLPAFQLVLEAQKSCASTPIPDRPEAVREIAKLGQRRLKRIVGLLKKEALG